MTVKFMDKESWIASRTDNPDRLGKDAWERMYDSCVSQARRDPIVKGSDITEDIRRKMVEEFVSKTGLDCDLSDDFQYSTAKMVFDWPMEGEEYQSKSVWQTLIDIAPKRSKNMKKKSSLESAVQKGSTQAKSGFKSSLVSLQQRKNDAIKTTIRRRGTVHGR